MNRHERRRQARILRQNKFVDGYVRHLPEVDQPDITKPGVVHMVCYHDDWCSIYDKDGGGLASCNCRPTVKYHVEPARS